MWPWRALWGDDLVAVGAVGVLLLPVLVAFEEGERFGGSRAGQLLPLRVALCLPRSRTCGQSFALESLDTLIIIASRYSNDGQPLSW